MPPKSTDPSGASSDKPSLADLNPPLLPDSLDDMISELPIAIYTFDQNGLFTNFNEVAVELWGRRPERGKDRWCGSWKAYHPNGYPMALDSCPVAVVLKEGSTAQGEEIVIERPDHTFRNSSSIPAPFIKTVKYPVHKTSWLTLPRLKKHRKTYPPFCDC